MKRRQINQAAGIPIVLAAALVVLYAAAPHAAACQACDGHAAAGRIVVEDRDVAKLAELDFTEGLVVTAEVDGNLFLAVLAAETGLEKKARDHREVALLIDDTGTARERLRPYFPED